jgi:Ni/Co efflux regulator RcnB
MTKFLTAIFLTATLLCSSTALAKHGRDHDDDDNDRHHEHEDKHHKHGRYDDDHVLIVNQNRQVITQYIYEDYNSHCPPGQRKKGHCGTPAGSRRYVVGQVLPERVIWEPLPQTVIQRIEPAPVGYQYVRVDKDVLLMSSASHKIIDAITLLSAVGQ